MNPNRYVLPLILLAVISGAGPGAADPSSATLVPFTARWPEPDQTAKPWTRWWWPGNALTPEDTRKDLDTMADAGLGGVEITPIYGSRDGRRAFRAFLSPAYLEILDATTQAAAERGLGVDMCTGTGWPFGGPNVTIEDAAKKAVWSGGTLRAAPTGQQVKRAAPGGEGLVLDPFSPTALERYLAPFTRALETLPRHRIRCQTHDSFEYYDASWTPDLPNRFLERFGYPLEEAATAIFSIPPDDPEKQQRARYDYRLLLAEQHLEYIRTWRAWCARMGYLAREQAHGAPANLLDLYGAADIPEMETFGARDYPIPGYAERQADPNRREDTPEPLIWRFAASAAHVTGKSLVSCETCTWIRNHWHATPADIKPFLDELYCAGINHVVFHGWCFSPAEAPWPGWYFYAAEQFNPRNPIWPGFVDMFRWITRTQSLLQQSAPDNDLLLYWPFDDALTAYKPDRLVAQFTVHDPSWALDTSFGAAARLLTAHGYSLDYLSDTSLKTASAENGLIRLPGGVWRAMVVPRTIRMRPETLEHLLNLAESGAVLVMESLPETVPGLGRQADRQRRLVQQCRRISNVDHADTQGTGAIRRITFGQGRIWVGPLDQVLTSWDLPSETLTRAGLTWIRRRGIDHTLYYVACLGPKGVDGWVHFARGTRTAVLMDPVSGRIGLGAVWQQDGTDGASVYLQLRPGESLFVVFPKGIVQGHPAPWRYYRTVASEPAETGPWTLHFESGVTDTLPRDRTMSEPRFWTDSDDPVYQAFSGTATYRTTIRVPALGPGEALALNPGDIRYAARIRLDQEPPRAVWCLPFRIVFDPPPAPGEHTLEITVFTLGANSIRELDRRKVPWRIMDNADIVDIHYKPLEAADWPVVPSGLNGPVILDVLQTLDPTTLENSSVPES